ncbi:testis-specific serine/threonine-protein kinase 1-like [Poeciliopsis prolifica]|uniref:testis-specific serine/threonine-protein kinase 1-like n=1 Tax=Poeciliopsis prolifica TaxID=188132 RepID=UPI002413A2CC|nr:testis-specific serine/threonine-protein kinase 1-like [Poeciliopsis prolifica]
MMEKTFMETRGYTYKAALAEGSFGKVVKAESIHLKKIVAIKVIGLNKYTTVNREKFVTQEKEIIRTLKHPNIVKTYDVFESRSEMVYVVMELCPQGDVAKLISTRGPLDECFSCRLFKQLCLAIEYLHGIDIAHKDIKCENLLLDMHYNLKLCDFGFSEKVTYNQGKLVLSDTHCGTLQYAAPEILKNLPHNSKISDVWSMGVVLYKMLCGSLPFTTTNTTKLVQLQLKHNIKFPTDPSISSLAKELIHSILHPVVDHRITVSRMLESPWMVKAMEEDSDEGTTASQMASQTASQTASQSASQTASRTPSQTAPASEIKED